MEKKYRKTKRKLKETSNNLFFKCPAVLQQVLWFVAELSDHFTTSCEMSPSRIGQGESTKPSEKSSFTSLALRKIHKRCYSTVYVNPMSRYSQCAHHVDYVSFYVFCAYVWVDCQLKLLIGLVMSWNIFSSKVIVH